MQWGQLQKLQIIRRPDWSIWKPNINLLKVQQGEEEEDVDIQIPRDLIKDNPSVLTKQKKNKKNT